MSSYICFSCGKAIKKDICEHCGYFFSLSQKCPRLINNGVCCIHTRRPCKEQTFELCKILQSNN
jgi:hypothetical protein